MSLQAAAGLLNLLQVTGGAAILYLSSTSSSSPAKEGRWFTGGKCAIEPCDMCTTLAALAVLTVFSGFLIKVTKVTLACVCPRTGDGIDSEKVVEIVARCALAFGWLFLATAVTISLNQVEMHDQYVILDAGHQPHPAADDSNSFIGHQQEGHVDHQALLFYLLWIMAFMSLGLAVLAVASAFCLACCCCCCNADTLCAWAPCAAMCCFCCSDGRRGDDCCCCSPLWCAEVLCLGWLVRKLWWQPDPHFSHTRHHCHHHHDPPYHPPMPPPPPAQVVVHGGSDYYYGPQAGLKDPLLASGPGIGGAPSAYGGSSSAAWRSPQVSQPTQPYFQGDPYYQPPIIQPAASTGRQGKTGAKGDDEDFTPSAPPK